MSQLNEKQKKPIEKESIIRVLFNTIDEVNQLLPKKEQIIKSLDAGIFGKENNLDSLGRIMVIVAFESSISEEFGLTLSLADGKILTQKENPFKTVGSLADYILLSLN